MSPSLLYVGVVRPLMAVIWFWLLNVRVWEPVLDQLPSASRLQLLVELAVVTVSSELPLLPLDVSVPRRKLVIRPSGS